MFKSILSERLGVRVGSQNEASSKRPIRVETMIQRQLMVSCAFGALLLSAGASVAQTAAAAAPVAGTSNTPDQAARAEATKQNDNASSATAVGEVIVTALPRAASLQNIPVAVSAYTDERRNLVGITTANDIVNFTPSMSLNGEFLSLRGVNRTLTSSFGPPPGIAVFVDGIYTDSPDYLNQPDFFSDRIEILRGPQGDLSGRNAIGGAVYVVSKRPTPDFHEEARFGHTDNAYTYADGSISGPITDTLDFRVADAYSHQPKSDGFYTNLAAPVHPGSGDTNLAEVQLEWKPTSNLDGWLRIQNFASSGAQTVGVNPDEYPGATINPAYGGLGYAAGTRCPNLQCLGPNITTELPPTSNPQITNPNVVNYNNPGYTRLTNDFTFTGQLTYTAPYFTIQYLGGYSEYHYRALTDIDGTALNTSEWDNAISLDNEAKSYYQNEVDIKSIGNGKLQWSAGVFQFSERFSQQYMTEEPNNADLLNPTFQGTGAFAAPNPNHITYMQTPAITSNSQAVFGEVDYKITDTFKLTVGARYTWDQDHATNSIREVFDTSGVFLAPGIGSLDVTPSPSSGSANKSWSDWSGKIGAEWQPDPSTLVYGFVAKGYKSGGFILTDLIPIPAVGPETLYDYEGGIKKTFGSTLLINADAFYYDYHNLQEILDFQNDSGIVLQGLVNAHRARTYGFELESVWSPINNFHLTFNYSYLNAKFASFTNTLFPGQPFVDFSVAPGVDHANLNGGTLPQSPTNKVTVNPLYTFNVPTGQLTLSATYAFVDSQYYGIFTTPEYKAPSYYDLDLRALYQPTGGHYTFILFARNVTNQTQIVNFTTGPYTAGPANLVPAGGVFATRGQTTYYKNDPRVIGGEVQVRF
jgi:iron complex outermembrane receptor protein